MKDRSRPSLVSENRKNEIKTMRKKRENNELHEKMSKFSVILTSFSTECERNQVKNKKQRRI